MANGENDIQDMVQNIEQFEYINIITEGEAPNVETPPVPEMKA